MNQSVHARAYHLLGSLLVGDRSAVGKARLVAPLAEMLRGHTDVQVAASHHSIFALEAFPYAGVFTHEAALIGGRIANRVSSSVLKLGDTRASERLAMNSPDHVGNILMAIGVHKQLGKLEEARALATEGLLPWLAPWLAAVARQSAGFWRFAVETTVELLAEDLGDAAPAPPTLAPAFAVSQNVGLADIASALCRPAISGALLTGGDIRRLGREHNLPTGFGNRKLMLTNLLRSAGEFGCSDGVLQALRGFFRAQAAAFVDVTRTEPQLNREIAAPWSERALATAESLAAMSGEVEQDTRTVG